MSLVICYNDNCEFWNNGLCTAKVTRVNKDGECETIEWSETQDEY